ncbi:hypothetical protein F4677DRAFT_440583 [Hypoxylon crocopeplum]|nr:hypothetical protein F4677DRAFT_440583 [Hypoxylon crocopeplum]
MTLKATAPDYYSGWDHAEPSTTSPRQDPEEQGQSDLRDDYKSAEIRISSMKTNDHPCPPKTARLPTPRFPPSDIPTYRSTQHPRQIDLVNSSIASLSDHQVNDGSREMPATSSHEWIFADDASGFQSKSSCPVTKEQGAGIIALKNLLDDALSQIERQTRSLYIDKQHLETLKWEIDSSLLEARKYRARTDRVDNDSDRKDSMSCQTLEDHKIDALTNTVRQPLGVPNDKRDHDECEDTMNPSNPTAGLSSFRREEPERDIGLSKEQGSCSGWQPSALSGPTGRVEQLDGLSDGLKMSILQTQVDMAKLKESWCDTQLDEAKTRESQVQAKMAEARVLIDQLLLKTAYSEGRQKELVKQKADLETRLGEVQHSCSRLKNQVQEERQNTKLIRTEVKYWMDAATSARGSEEKLQRKYQKKKNKANKLGKQLMVAEETIEELVDTIEELKGELIGGELIEADRMNRRR